MSDWDSVWPRIPDYRYRIYAVLGGSRIVLAAAPDPAGIGVALVQLHDDAKAIGGRLADEGRIGVLDVLPERHGYGEWIVLPWDRTPA